MPTTTPVIPTTPFILATTSNEPTTQVVTTSSMKPTTIFTTNEMITTSEVQTTTTKAAKIATTLPLTTSPVNQRMCLMETTLVEGFVLTWPAATPGNVVPSLEKCSNDSTQGMFEYHLVTVSPCQ